MDHYVGEYFPHMNAANKKQNICQKGESRETEVRFLLKMQFISPVE